MKNKQLLIKSLHRLADGVLPLFFWILLIFGFDKPYIGILTIITTIIHEIGHYSIKLFLYNDGKIPHAHMSGFRLRVHRLASYNYDILLLAAGPLTNLLVFILLIPFSFSDYVRSFALLNLVTSISNLLPVVGYDGYSILVALFRKNGNDSALKFITVLSFVLCAFLCFLSLYFIYRISSGYWIYGLFFVLILSEIQKAMNTAINEN